MFDFGFTRFITNTWISLIWAVNVIATCFAAVVGIGAGLMIAVSGSPEAVVLVLAAPLFAALWLLFSRISLELTIVMFRIETHLRAMRERGE